jgi:hypothetical protein
MYILMLTFIGGNGKALSSAEQTVNAEAIRD